MADDKSFNDLGSVVVRTYGGQDHAVVTRLYAQGLLAGQIPPHDTGSDIEHIQDAYFNDECNHLWVAQLRDEVVGMIGVVRSSEHTAEIRRLRVEKHYQDSGIAARLVEIALSHCKHYGYLKIVLDTRFDPDVALDLFDRFGFQHTRTKNVHGKDLLEFYLDLYRQPQTPRQVQDNQGAA